MTSDSQSTTLALNIYISKPELRRRLHWKSGIREENIDMRKKR